MTILRILKLSIIITIFITSSCSSTISGKWRDCRQTESDLGCVNIAKADELSDQNNHPKESKTFNKTINKDEVFPVIKDYDIKDFPDKTLIRTSEKITRLWVAPYSDDLGNYHESKYIRIKQTDSNWLLANKY